MNYSIDELRAHAKENTYAVHGDIQDVDCVLGFSFGYIDTESGIRPGKSNQQLAEYINATYPTTPLILQFEINDALTSRTAEYVIHESRQPGQYLDSREIALQALEIMKNRKWNTVAVVTHPAMMARNDALCTKLGMNTVALSGLEHIDYDVDSAQPWTRDKISWWQREEKVLEIGAENGWI